jgi:hypothetical protein
MSAPLTDHARASRTAAARLVRVLVDPAGTDDDKTAEFAAIIDKVNDEGGAEGLTGVIVELAGGLAELLLTTAGPKAALATADLTLHELALGDLGASSGDESG